MVVSAPDHINEFTIDSPIFVVVTNNTQSELEISPDSDIKIYRQSDSNWESVNNKTDYLAVTDRLLPQGDSSPGLVIYTLAPSLQDSITQIRLCIVVEGIINNSDSSPRIGAYIEILLDH